MKYLYTIETKNSKIKKIKRGYLIDTVDHMKAFEKVQKQLSMDTLPVNETEFTIELMAFDTFEILK